MGYRGRDVEVTPLDNNIALVAACDSCGGIGNKALDLIQVPQYIVGRFTARVPLLEILSIGAHPRMITAAICCEPEPAGKEILKGIKDELSDAGLDDLPIGVSTEKNIETCQTGLGITVVGICRPEGIRASSSRPGDILYCIGLPKVGSEVTSPSDPEIANSKHITALLKNPAFHDIVPVGSRGIRAEAMQLAEAIGAIFTPLDNLPVNLNKSAGPATCLIVSCMPGSCPETLGQIPVFKIGEMTQTKKEDL